jgi:hypothetical protein
MARLDPGADPLLGGSVGGQEADGGHVAWAKRWGRSGICRCHPTPRPPVVFTASWPPTWSAVPTLPIRYTHLGRLCPTITVWPSTSGGRAGEGRWHVALGEDVGQGMPLSSQASPINSAWPCSWPPTCSAVPTLPARHTHLGVLMSHTYRVAIDIWRETRMRTVGTCLGEGVGQIRHMPLSSHASPIFPPHTAILASHMLDTVYLFVSGQHLGCSFPTHPVRPSILGGRPGGEVLGTCLG